MIRSLFIILSLAISGCAATGHSVGVTHGVSVDGDGQYHAPHYTRESEKLDVGVQYYHFTDREEVDFMEVDWNYKF